MCQNYKPVQTWRLPLNPDVLNTLITNTQQPLTHSALCDGDFTVNCWKIYDVKVKTDLKTSLITQDFCLLTKKDTWNYKSTKSQILSCFHKNFGKKSVKILTFMHSSMCFMLFYTSGVNSVILSSFVWITIFMCFIKWQASTVFVILIYQYHFSSSFVSNILHHFSSSHSLLLLLIMTPLYWGHE